MRLRLASFVAVVSALSITALSFTACSGSDPRPDAGSTNTNGSSSSSSSGSVPTDSGADSAQDSGGDADAALPDSCSNTVRDGTETDVDCGGGTCNRCVDGKKCVQNTDCKGNSCTQNKCVTPTCTDAIRNGDESDNDCGGTICAKCQFGKRCKKNEDCISNTCNVGEERCKCPEGMVEVPRTNGASYCVDAVETTKGAYYKFWIAGYNYGDQPAECTTNVSFTPRDSFPPAQTPGGINFNVSLPVHYVDWCDAYAYCQWAGKQLCGKINGGAISPASANDASQDAWFNACTAAGNQPYPYAGSAYQGGKCNTTGVGTSGPTPGDGYGYAENGDKGVYSVINATNAQGDYTEPAHLGCQGGAVGLYQMSGNVAEWEDSCDGAAATSNCRLRGGSYNSYKDVGDEVNVRCDATRTEVRMPTDPAALADVGFRCCLY